jgi:hypothetical protein
MLTSFQVKCPSFECDWSGSLIPRVDREPWHGQATNDRRPLVVFRCPRCSGEWRGRIVGDDVRIVPAEAAVV